MAGALTNNHYVWKHYLEAWSSPKFFCYRRSDCKLFGAQPKVVANERNFYQTYRLSAADLQYLERLIERASFVTARESSREFVRLFQATFELRDRIAEGRLPDEEISRIEGELGEIERTIGEKYHTRLEGDGIGYLDDLRRGSTAFFRRDEDCAKFLYFVSNQYFRTPKVRRAAQYSTLLAHDPRRTAPLEAHIYASNVGMSLYASRASRRIVMLRSDGSIPFITGDQPIFNLLDPTKSEDVELYYPVSPERAMILTRTADASSDHERILGKMAIETYNHFIWCASHDQVYANDRNYLQGITALPRNIGRDF